MFVFKINVILGPVANAMMIVGIHPIPYDYYDYCHGLSEPTRFSHFTRSIRVQAFRDSKMLSDHIPQKVPRGVKTCLTLFPEASREPEEKDLVQFTMKVWAGSASTPTYKRRDAHFANGTPSKYHSTWLS